MTARLLDRHVSFVAALRRRGLRVSIAEDLDAARAMASIELIDRDQLRSALAATLVKRQAQRPLFDLIFDVYYPPVTGTSALEPFDGVTPKRHLPPAPRDAIEDPVRDAIRDLLAEYLASGDEQLLAQAVRDSIEAFGTESHGREGGPGMPGRARSPRAILAKVSAQTLMAGILAQVLSGVERGGVSEQRARTMINDRIRRFEDAVEAGIRRRVAEQTGVEIAVRDWSRPSVDEVPFLDATRADLAEVRREIQPLARRLAAKLAQDQRRGSRGQLDFRATVRASLSTGGVPMATHHRPRRPHKTDLVVLCDLSDSVASFARFTLLLAYALREQFSRVRAFGFVDELDGLTRFFTPGGDVVDAMTRLAAEADVTGATGRTDYGRAIELFAQRFDDVVGPRTSLLVLGDARSNYGYVALPTLRRIAGKAKHAYWLNPERRAMWNTGDSRARDFDAITPMVECRNLAQLAEFAKQLGR